MVDLSALRPSFYHFISPNFLSERHVFMWATGMECTCSIPSSRLAFPDEHQTSGGQETKYVFKSRKFAHLECKLCICLYYRAANYWYQSESFNTMAEAHELTFKYGAENNDSNFEMIDDMPRASLNSDAGIIDGANDGKAGTMQSNDNNIESATEQHPSQKPLTLPPKSTFPNPAISTPLLSAPKHRTLLDFFKPRTKDDVKAYWDRQEEEAVERQLQQEAIEKDCVMKKKKHECDLVHARVQKHRATKKEDEIRSGIRDAKGTKRKVQISAT